MLSAVEHRVCTGDVVEVEVDDEVVSALVLLASDEAVILDACDGRTPFVVRPSDLLGSRVYSGQAG